MGEYNDSSHDYHHIAEGLLQFISSYSIRHIGFLVGILRDMFDSKFLTTQDMLGDRGTDAIRTESPSSTVM
jgi:hypothetical protein